MTVRRLLARYRGVRAHVLPNPGNAGDGLIQRGLRRLCAEYDLAVTELYEPHPAAGRLLLAPGAGNLSAAYDGAARRIAAYAGRFDTVAILPCSVDLASDATRALLSNLPAHAHVFCREAYSFALVRELLGADRNVWLDHDLAFGADVAAWQRPGRGTLYAFRSDAESCEPPPSGNFDVSAITGEWMTDLFLDVVSAFAVVHTDRAHVAIAAAMLGRETHVYPNAYHKLRGIYEFSLARYPRTRFHEDRTELPPLDGGDDVRTAIWRARAQAELAPGVRAAESFA